MIFFLKGIVRFIEENLIVLEVNNIGYQVYVTKPNNYHIDDEIFLYVYQINRQDSPFLVGFSDLEEKEGFLLLIRISGVGPKVAMNILRQVSIKEIFAAIKENDDLFFAHLNGVNSRLATQIILELESKMKKFESKVTLPSKSEAEVKEALIQLGFKPNKIDAIMPKLDRSKPIEELLKDALSLINKI